MEIIIWIVSSRTKRPWGSNLMWKSERLQIKSKSIIFNSKIYILRVVGFDELDDKDQESVKKSFESIVEPEEK